MKPHSRAAEQDDLLRPRLVDMIDPRHELVKLATLIDWEFIEREWAGFFPSATGRPATSPRLIAGLMYLQHAFKLSDEAVVARWVENPYYQHLTGETFFQHRPPIDPSSLVRWCAGALVRWRKRIGEEGAEWLLTKTIKAGRSSGTIPDKAPKRVAIDTTVMEKDISHPTDARLYERARGLLVGLAEKARISLRQSYARLAPRLAFQAGRYAHARQFKRMRKALRTLKGYTGRVRRDLRRHLQDIPGGPLRDQVLEALWRVGRLLEQGPKSRDKIYSLHEPEVDCISKGKARVRYEFGTKVSLTTTLDGGFIVGARSFPGNPHDGHTLAPALEQVEILTDTRPSLAVVDRGYRGHGVETTRVLISGQRRGLTPVLAKLLKRRSAKRRSAIEPEIGHMKSDGRLARCPLKGRTGDALFTILCTCGHNTRKILAHLRALWTLAICLVLAIIGRTDRALRSPCAV